MLRLVAPDHPRRTGGADPLTQAAPRVDPNTLKGISLRRHTGGATYADSVGLHKHLAVERSLDKAFRCGLDVLVWTLRRETRADIAQLFELGVDGVLTDFREKAVAVRGERVARVA